MKKKDMLGTKTKATTTPPPATIPARLRDAELSADTSAWITEVLADAPLEKGAMLDADMLASRLGVPIESGRFALALLKLKEHYTKALAEAGIPAVVKTEDRGLRVLTDAETGGYASARTCQHIRGLHRALSYLDTVELVKLSGEERIAHDHTKRVIGAVVDNVNHTIRQFRVNTLPAIPWKRPAAGGEGEGGGGEGDAEGEAGAAVLAKK